jgi:hypothetical protein
MEIILLNKKYGWEESFDLPRDVDECTDLIPESEMPFKGEFKGTIQVTIKYIPSEEDPS